MHGDVAVIVSYPIMSVTALLSASSSPRLVLLMLLISGAPSVPVSSSAPATSGAPGTHTVTGAPSTPAAAPDTHVVFAQLFSCFCSTCSSCCPASLSAPVALDHVVLAHVVLAHVVLLFLQYL